MFRKRSSSVPKSPDQIYEGLRTAALSVTAEQSGDPPPDHVSVLGAVVDIPAEGGMASVVAMADGSASMYTSTGGGVIGGGKHEAVEGAVHGLGRGGGRPVMLVNGRRISGFGAVRNLPPEAIAKIEIFPEDDRVDLPPTDMVQITVMTPRGRRRACVPAAAFWGAEPSTVVELIAAIQDVMTTIRGVAP